jgi:ribonucleoside-diphosphate reductase alpha chain
MIPENEAEEIAAIEKSQQAEQASKQFNPSISAADSAISNQGVSGGGIAPDPYSVSGLSLEEMAASGVPSAPTMADRGIFHAADAMRDMYEMGDAPSCSTCGAIMVRNGSCYRCMSCGSTSGCS